MSMHENEVRVTLITKTNTNKAVISIKIQGQATEEVYDSIKNALKVERKKAVKEVIVGSFLGLVGSVAMAQLKFASKIFGANEEALASPGGKEIIETARLDGMELKKVGIQKLRQLKRIQSIAKSVSAGQKIH